ncbi:OmpA family protein [Mucilaginibacter sp. UR6-11]|uniref:OmpA family protein n=1 Tax=Mucilaginibacter sp. UR6-11 TaxID=1435644 RepID=UPI001E4EB86E|nr:OmpA family protein [Mucilaginibacter sp. UR6-11]MCC8425390.1 OmpA family protein [Mucilaginibacter sp. UR6-11]
MNYSTLKKTVALSFVSLMVIGAANAQTTETTSSTTTTAKVFGGSGQYNTWSIGLNVGATSPTLATGGGSDFPGNVVNLGYGLSVKKQLAHSFALQLDLHGGKVQGTAGNRGFVTDQRTGNNYIKYSTPFWQGTISGVVNVATIDYLRRKNAINFLVSAGAGLVNFNPTIYGANTPGFPTITSETYNTASATNTNPHTVTNLVIPVGVGVKFRLSDAVGLNLGYTENFIDGDVFDGVNAGYHNNDHYSYGYAGLEFTLGSKSKANLEWVNPVAMMYDELYDEALRKEVEALKGRVTNVENAVNDLKKDSDGDGVADQFDKCPNTPAGTVVDGSGCAIVFPKAVDTTMNRSVTGAAYSNIQFEFDSSVLRTSSYPVLDATSADLRASGSRVELDGFASSEGTAAHNLALSKDRANSVKTYLVNSGVDAKKIKVKAYGETMPIADNSTEEGRVLNRRVQFKK